MTLLEPHTIPRRSSAIAAALSCAAGKGALAGVSFPRLHLAVGAGSLLPQSPLPLHPGAAPLRQLPLLSEQHLGQLVLVGQVAGASVRGATREHVTTA